jgi:hypothetical protein
MTMGPDWHTGRSYWAEELTYRFHHIVTDCTCTCDEVLEAVAALPKLQSMALAHLDLRSSFTRILQTATGLTSFKVTACIMPDDFVEQLRAATVRGMLLESISLNDCYCSGKWVVCENELRAADDWDAGASNCKTNKYSQAAIEHDWQVVPTRGQAFNTGT